MFLTKRLVALGAWLAFAGYRPVGLVFLDCPFLSDERTGKSCHLPPPLTFGRGVSVCLRDPLWMLLSFYQQYKEIEIRGQTSHGEPRIQVGSSRVRVFPSSKGRG